MRGAIGRNVLVHHLDPPLTIDFQAKLHEVLRRCNVKSAHDARDHHSSRGRRLRCRESQRCLVIVKRVGL